MSEKINTTNNSEENHKIHDAEGFIARMREQFKPAETVQNRIDELVMKGEEGKDELEGVIRQMTIQSLKDDDDFMANAKKINSGRMRPEDEEELIERQRHVLDNRRLIIAEIAGVPNEAIENDIEQAKDRLASMVEPGDSPEDILKKLDILRINKDNQEVFNYPHSLMPESTNTKWEVYLTTVAKHVKLVREGGGDLSLRADTEYADNLRHFAHNRVTKDVHHILGFDKLDQEQWSFKMTRDLLAKMRDARFPTIETAESKLTGSAIKDAVAATETLNKKMNDFE